MSFINEQFENDIFHLLEKTPLFKISPRKDEESLHGLLESRGMKIGRNIDLCYSRRPNLWKSFEESRQRPLFFSDEMSEQFMAVLSETTCYYKKEKAITYYNSDLRVKKGAPLTLTKSYRDVYRSLIDLIPNSSPCVAAVMDDNHKAIRALTSAKNPFVYNKMFGYEARSIIVLPSIKLSRPSGLENLEVRKVCKSDQLERFLENYLKECDFSNDILESRYKQDAEDEFVIKRDEKILGYFSFYRPRYRCLIVKSSSLWLRFILLMIKLFSGENLAKKVPWVYLSSLVLLDELEGREEVLSAIIQKGFQEKRISYGDVVLMTLPHGKAPKLKGSTFLRCPVFINNIGLYRVESYKTDRMLKGEIHLDPTEL